MTICINYYYFNNHIKIEGTIRMHKGGGGNERDQRETKYQLKPKLQTNAHYFVVCSRILIEVTSEIGN